MEEQKVISALEAHRSKIVIATEGATSFGLIQIEDDRGGAEFRPRDAAQLEQFCAAVDRMRRAVLMNADARKQS